jgi:peptidoglycan/xylan/chitin deacetylase (PgdA/CDA1 family)
MTELYRLNAKKSKPHNSIFVISLDFELYWGLRDKTTLESYQENLLGARAVIPMLIELFDNYKISATWAIVGLLFYATQRELIANVPLTQPNYVDTSLSPYPHLSAIGNDERSDPFHYAASLIKTIASFPSQEIGTHTFSHYYCREQGQTAEEFREDLKAAIQAANQYGLTIKSLVFPRNQVNREYLSICQEMGLLAYRGNEKSWIYRVDEPDTPYSLQRALRLLDAYINYSGHNCYSLQDVARSFPFNIPSSRFLRPYSQRLKFLEPLRLRRILSGMHYTAKRGLIYHLWWHPHNFGSNTNENLAFLKTILKHYLKLRQDYGMQSLSMGDLACQLYGR